jgi:hypothetical protein
MLGMSRKVMKQVGVERDVLGGCIMRIILGESLM